jgi:hypothetical protein
MGRKERKTERRKKNRNRQKAKFVCDEGRHGFAFARSGEPERGTNAVDETLDEAGLAPELGLAGGLLVLALPDLVLIPTREVHLVEPGLGKKTRRQCWLTEGRALEGRREQTHRTYLVFLMNL